MPKKLIKGTIIGLERDGAPFIPTPGEVVDLTAEEVKTIEEANKAAIGDPKEYESDTSRMSQRKVEKTSLTPGAVSENSDLGGNESGDGSDTTTAAPAVTTAQSAARAGKGKPAAASDGEL